MSDAQYHSKLMATKLAAAMTLVFTIVVSLFMGFIKNEFSKINTQFLQYLDWHNANRRKEWVQQEFLNTPKAYYILPKRNMQ